MARSAAAAPKLAEYQRKRRFSVTPEPRAKRPKAVAKAEPMFVVQKHAASHLHYDFRLEHRGVLLSWAVPKGPSVRAGERRLAMRTEDHPLAYADFEGVIPEGEYGGGRVLVWDRGTWQVEARGSARERKVEARGSAREQSSDGSVDKQLAAGRLTFTLRGEKLNGRFHLVRSKQERGRERWLLFKGADQEAADVDIVEERPESVLTGNEIEQVGGRVWHSNRRGAAKKQSVRDTRASKRAGPRTSKTTKPGAASSAAEKEAARNDVVRAVAGMNVGFALTSLEKELYPEQGLRKADLIAYYAAVATRMLPHVARRPLVLVRCPQGRKKKCFYQKHLEAAAPDAIRSVEIEESQGVVRYGYIEDMNGLVALAQLGVLEVHLWNCHVDRVESPDLFVFDLDPDEGLAWERVVEAALAVRARLEALGLESFVKTTGGKGLHVVLPVARKWSWQEHKAIAYAIVAELARTEPQRYVTNMRKQLRKGKIFLDYLRNGRGASAIAPYSTRAREGALVATPISWQELERGVRPSDFEIAAVVQRLQANERDPWQAFFTLKQSISAADLRTLLERGKRARR